MVTEHINQERIIRILLAITILGIAVSIAGYSYLIASNCGAFGANEFLSSVRAFHTQAGC